MHLNMHARKGIDIDIDTKVSISISVLAQQAVNKYVIISIPRSTSAPIFIHVDANVGVDPYIDAYVEVDVDAYIDIDTNIGAQKKKIS